MADSEPTNVHGENDVVIRYLKKVAVTNHNEVKTLIVGCTGFLSFLVIATGIIVVVSKR